MPWKMEGTSHAWRELRPGAHRLMVGIGGKRRYPAPVGPGWIRGPVGNTWHDGGSRQGSGSGSDGDRHQVEV